MKKLIYLIVAIAVLGLIVPGCIPVVPPVEQNETSGLMKWNSPDLFVDDDYTSGTPGWGSTHFATIGEAITAASGGNTIEVAEGTYTEAVTVNKSVTLLGANYDVDPAGELDRGGESVIVGQVTITAYNATVNGFKLTSSYIAAGYNSALNVNISYNILENVTATWGAIHLHGTATGPSYHECDGGYIGYNTISGAVGDGIWTVGNNDVTIEYNHIISSSGFASIQALNHVGTEIVIHGNTITNSGGKGINYWADDGGEITDNVITNSTHEAIFTDRQATISGNQIFGGGGYGILVVGDAAGSTVSGNTISNPSFEGIQSDVQVIITNNDISGGNNGIQLSNAASGSVIDDNTISSPSWIGIKSFVPVDITNNNINGGWSGLEIISGAGGSTVNGNTVSGTTAEALRVFAQATITNNNFSGGYSGIGIWGNGTVISGNNIHDNDYWGLSIQPGVTDATVTNNQFTNNPYCGVTVWGDGDGSGININYNEITGNGIYGVESQRTASDVNATYNWWGHASGPSGEFGRVNKQGKVIGKGDAVSDHVNWDPWLSQPTVPPTQILNKLDLKGSFISHPNYIWGELVGGDPWEYSIHIKETMDGNFSVGTIHFTSGDVNVIGIVEQTKRGYNYYGWANYDTLAVAGRTQYNNTFYNFLLLYCEEYIQLVISSTANLEPYWTEESVWDSGDRDYQLHSEIPSSETFDMDPKNIH